MQIPKRGLSIRGVCRQDAPMRNEAHGDVLKVWLYAAASVWLGAWFSPLLYNAGKALAEVSQGKTINGPFEWLAGVCVRADFQAFFMVSMMLAAAVLFFPWMEWLHARRGSALASGPWGLRLPDGARVSMLGQSLRKNPQGPWHFCAGFLLLAGLLLPMGIALVAAGWFKLGLPADVGLVAHLAGTFFLALFTAAVAEVLFRGIVMGVFLRAMRPAAALGMSAAFFALVASLCPPSGMHVVDPEARGVGFEMLRLLALRFADGTALLGTFAPLLVLGLVLSYARWRTASLWLPIGIHAGWLTAKNILNGMVAIGTNSPSLLSADVLQHFLLPVAAILITGALAHYLTANPPQPDASRS
jgi:membrane protease YdiL (CAAX protease family)